MWLEWLYLLYLFIGLVSAYTRADASADLVNSLPDYKGPTLTFKQYAGYLELSSGNALFYWLTKSPKQSDPVILWLSGGPGCSSTFALLTEHGPYRLKDDGQSLTYNPYAWNQYAHMIYLDAPAGVGFSLNRNKQYNFTDTQVAQNNMEALERFFDKFPELIFNDLYISGESYGGTYVPMLGSLISKNTNKFPTFKGIIVGNGCLHEKIRFNSQIPFNYNHDFISDKFYNSAVEKCCKKPASECDWYNLYENSGDDCFYIIDQLQNANFYSGLDPYFINYACYLDDSAPKKPSKTPRNTYFQFRRKNLQKLDSQQSCADETDTEVYLNRADVKAALHVPSDVKFESCSDMVADYYIIEYEDMGPFVKDIVVDSTRRSLFFNGDVDTVISMNSEGDVSSHQTTVKVWSTKQLQKLGQSKLDTLYRSYCITNQLTLPKTQLKAKKAIELLLSKPVESYEDARERFVKYKKDQEREYLRKVKVEGRFTKVRNVESGGSKEATRLKQRLKYGNRANSIDIENPAKLQKALFKQLEKAVNVREKTLNWDGLSRQFIDAYVINSFDALNEFQSELFFKYTKLFFKMIEKRGYRCLWDERVYYCISVENWFRRLVFMASVQWYDENEDEDTCLVSPTVKGRLTAARKSKNKLKLKDAHLIQVLCSLINKETTASNDPFIYNRDYEAAHTCQFKRCVNVYHIRRTTKAENWNEHVELNLVWFFDQLGLPLVQERTAWLYNKKLPKTSGYYTGYKNLDFVTVVGAGHFVSAASEKPRENLQIFVNFLRNRDYSTPI